MMMMTIMMMMMMMMIGDRIVGEMLTCLKKAVEETDIDFNSAWDVDVDKLYLPMEYIAPMSEE